MRDRRLERSAKADQSENYLRFRFAVGRNADASDLFNRILWTAIRGDGVPYPEPKQVSIKELTLGR